ncbi:hypothetical protein [Williamsia sp. DF01-3]|uniref:hypothetical protein n=1 Tax=Williamsia sp. DF01-3 TaxID=2934157 RepID=UPI001FF541C8|nr:hypothetical protein [Williamsia sp. DF01-3]MCK0517646.1 hypothetical protein [Williamsia sp. DF01-3]
MAIIGAVIVLIVGALIAVSFVIADNDGEIASGADNPATANPLPRDPLPGRAWAESQQVDLIETGDPPEFPTRLEQWALQQTWDATPRAFKGQETAVPGPGFTKFPATMNGCDNQRFLVRWRVLNPDATVVASLADVNGTVVNNATGSAGRMDLDGCLTPQFEFAESGDASNLTDITVAVQQWSPSP